MSADAAPHEPAKIVLRIKGEAIEHIFKLGTDLRVKVRFEGKGKIGGHVVTTSLYLPACMEAGGPGEGISLIHLNTSAIHCNTHQYTAIHMSTH